MDSMDSLELKIEELESLMNDETDRADTAEQLNVELQGKIDELTEERDNLKGYMEVIYEKASAAL